MKLYIIWADPRTRSMGITEAHPSTFFKAWQHQKRLGHLPRCTARVDNEQQLQDKVDAERCKLHYH